MSAPLEMPPWIPPEWLVVVPADHRAGSNGSLWRAR